MRILQIMPAPGWVAKVASLPPQPPNPGGSEVVLPLVAWALVDFEDGSREVVGMVCSKQNGITVVDEGVEGFLGYEYKET